MISDSEMAGISSARQRLLQNVDGPLRVTECVLCEDFKTVMFYAPDGHDWWAAACFDLDHPIREDQFDARPYLRAVQRAHLRLV
jgi:hypothetical protein